MAWYTACLKFVYIVGDLGITEIGEAVCIVRAESKEAALQAAHKFGSSKEQKAIDDCNEPARLVFVGVSSLDKLGDRLTSGTEIYFTPTPLKGSIPIDFNTVFYPENQAVGSFWK